jgi:hypothetical protein
MSGYGGVSISEMKDFSSEIDAIPLSNDIGNVISLGGGEADDFEMGLIANAKYTSRIANAGGSSSQRQNTFPVESHGYGGSGSGSSSGIDIQALPPVESINLDIPLAPLEQPNITINRVDGFGSGGQVDNGFNNASSFDQYGNNAGGGGGIQLNVRDPEAEKKEKIDLITKLSRLEAKGYPVARRFTMDNSLEEVKSEYNRLVDAKQLEGSIKFQRQMMMTFTTGLEMMNEKFNPLDWQLKGWSESVHENIEDFDEVFEELYDKYKERGKMPPEARLLFMMVGSGFMFHMSNSFFRSKMPSAEDILKNNPALAKQFAAAAANAAGPGYGNFMGMAMGVPQGGAPQMQMPMPMPQMQQMPQMAQMPQQYAAAPQRVARKEMNGPSDVDDILKTFQEVRQSELQFGNAPMMPQPIPANASQQSMIFSQPAVVAASEINSIHSDDMLSQAESTRTGGTRGGGQRRRKAAPIGNAVTIDV